MIDDVVVPVSILSDLYPLRNIDRARVTPRLRLYTSVLGRNCRVGIQKAVCVSLEDVKFASTHFTSRTT